MSSEVLPGILLAERAAVIARQAQENSEETAAICRGLVMREAQLREELRRANENVAQLQALVIKLLSRVEVIENTGAALELGPPLCMDDQPAWGDPGAAQDAAEYEQCAVLSGMALEQAVYRHAIGTGVVDVDDLAEKLASGSGPERANQVEHYEWAIRDMLDESNAWEVVERDRRGHSRLWRCDDPGMMLDNASDATAHLRLKHDGSADRDYYQRAMQSCAQRRQRARKIS